MIQRSHESTPDALSETSDELDLVLETQQIPSAYDALSIAIPIQPSSPLKKQVDFQPSVATNKTSFFRMRAYSPSQRERYEMEARNSLRHMDKINRLRVVQKRIPEIKSVVAMQKNLTNKLGVQQSLLAYSQEHDIVSLFR
jgi:hypothetical protein